ncbi:hypothetical protein THAOC_31126 [Thalassiosira oceanica]|uniref:Amino acid transporter transmembrane domain-containing protein n=1 Tax=Thalassiosira oceanica TaxID=159749 RepID=K0R8R7_THAOC|nr:hypothetical protein THAOC_31126 [Thalassiosira oceanica]|eukprot:EJK49948.1 hypothetical protein THAOC_31126 [Thalassiosira oceanica]
MKSVIICTALLCASTDGFQSPSQRPRRRRIGTSINYLDDRRGEPRATRKKPAFDHHGAEAECNDSLGGRPHDPLHHSPSSVYSDRSPTSLAAATLQGAIEAPDSMPSSDALKAGRGLVEGVSRVASASLLITGNTVGSSMFVLPEAVGEVGMQTGSALFLGIYIFNLISGLLLANVAISLHEDSDCEVPSSFKDFVDTAMKCEKTGTAMAGASLLSNSCFVAFGLVHAGNLLTETFPALHFDPAIGAGGFAAALAAASLTQTNEGLSKIANAACVVLFSGFLSLLVPSLANVSDPVGTFLAPGSGHAGSVASIAAAVPLILSSMTYQNIVPTVTKLLDFDRTKTTAAIAIGSLIPGVMYEAWSLCCLGGGLDSSISNGVGAAAFTSFSAAALVGSTLAALMSIAEEYESILFSHATSDDENCPVKTTFSLQSVALSMVPPTAVALACSKGGELSSAIHLNGAFISPLLYGVVPVMLFQAVQRSSDRNNVANSSQSISSLMPQAMLAAGSLACVGQEIMQDISSLSIPSVIS